METERRIDLTLEPGTKAYIPKGGIGGLLDLYRTVWVVKYDDISVTFVDKHNRKYQLSGPDLKKVVKSKKDPDSGIFDFGALGLDLASD